MQVLMTPLLTKSIYLQPGVKPVTTVSTDIEEEEERLPLPKAESAVVKKVRPDAAVEEVYPAALVEKVRSAAVVEEVRSAEVVEEGLPAVAAVADIEELDTVPAPAAAATGKSKFTEFNEKWLEETEEIAADFVSTPAMERLKAGSFGAKSLHALSHRKCSPLASLEYLPLHTSTLSSHLNVIGCNFLKLHRHQISKPASLCMHLKL